MNLPSELSAQLPDTFKQIALPALLAAAGTGGLTGYLSSRNRPHGETGSERRRRILRNALIGATMGGGAVAALPTGMRMLSEPFRERPGFNPTRAISDFAVGNAAPLGVGAGGAWYLNKLRGKEKATGIRAVLNALQGERGGQPVDVGAAGPIKGPVDLTRRLATGGREDVLEALARSGAGKGVGFGSTDRMLNAHELLAEAGHGGKLPESLRAMEPGRLRVTGSRGPGLQSTGNDAGIQAIRKYITNQSVLPESLRRFSLSRLVGETVGRSVGGRSTTPIAEAWLNNVRPGMRKMMGRGGALGRLGLLGGGIYAAKQLQDGLVGN